MPGSPDQVLMEKIIQEIRKSGLMLEDDLVKFEEKIRKRSLSQDIIRLFLENKIKSEHKG